MLMLPPTPLLAIREACIHDPVLVAVLVSAHLLVWLSYATISTTIVWVITKTIKLPLPLIWWLFAGFIFSCSGTHFCAALVFFRPAYHLEAVVAALTALVSFITAIVVVRYRCVIVKGLMDAYRLQESIKKVEEAVELKSKCEDLATTTEPLDTTEPTNGAG